MFPTVKISLMKAVENICNFGAQVRKVQPDFQATEDYPVRRVKRVKLGSQVFRDRLDQMEKRERQDFRYVVFVCLFAYPFCHLHSKDRDIE